MDQEVGARREWESECLQRTREALSDGSAESFGRVIDDVHLEGDYPSTELVVVWHWQDRPDQIVRGPFELWGEDFEARSGERDHPRTVALIVHSNIAAP
jgi:hypothetical protein